LPKALDHLPQNYLHDVNSASVRSELQTRLTDLGVFLGRLRGKVFACIAQTFLDSSVSFHGGAKCLGKAVTLAGKELLRSHQTGQIMTLVSLGQQDATLDPAGR
jgi:hypothetical protein